MRPGPSARRASTVGGIALALPVLLTACRSIPDRNPVYRPTEGILEVVAVLRLHVDDDTYRFPPARDFTGKNVYRASLARLESLEQIHGAKFSSGYVSDVILFAKGRALERLGEFGLAAQHYLRVTDLESELAPSAEWSRAICESLLAAREMTPAPEADVAEALGVFDRRSHELEGLVDQVAGSHYAPVVLEEIERTDAERARYVRARSLLDPRLERPALEQYKRLVDNHRESRRRHAHLLELADYYAELARRYSQRNPAFSLGFDPATFDEYAFGATRLYEAVANQDGAIEKVEAARKLEAFLAFSLEVRDAAVAR